MKKIFLLLISILCSNSFAEISDKELRTLFIVTEFNQLKEYGGMVLFKNFFDLNKDACGLKKAYPNMTIMIDQEGGSVSRIKEAKIVSANEVSKYTNEEYRNEVSNAAKVLKEKCIDVNLAPYIESNNNVRSYGSYENIVMYGNIFTEEMSKNNIKTIIKHFPGYQREKCSSIITNKNLIIKKGSEVLECSLKGTKDWENFKQGADIFKKVNSDGVMLSNIIFKGFDDNLFVLSSKTKELVNQENLNNRIIISDALWEIEITPEIILKAFHNVDWIMVGYPKDAEKGVEVIKQAIKDKKITEQQVLEKIDRINKFKVDKKI